MNKTELIAAVAEKSGLTRKDSEKAVLAALETITETLKTGGKGTAGWLWRIRDPRSSRSHGPQPHDRRRNPDCGKQGCHLQELHGQGSQGSAQLIKVSLRDKSGVATKGHAALFLPFFYKFPHERAERGKGRAVVIGVHGKANLPFAVLKRHGRARCPNALRLA